MPQLSDVLEKRKSKKFQKKSYRPWDLTGSDSAEAIKNNPESHNVAEESSSCLPHENLDENKIVQPPIHSVNETHNPPAIKNNSNQNHEYSGIGYKKPAAHTKDSNLDISQKPDSNIDSKQIAFREQTDSTLDDNQIAIRKQTDSVLDSNQVAIREQKDSSLDNTQHIDPRLIQIQNLSGIKKKIIDFVFDICIATNSSHTGPVQTATLTQYANTTYGTIKASLNRLIKSNLLVRRPGRRSKNGYINLELPEDVKSMLFEVRKNPNSNLISLNLPSSILANLDSTLDTSLDSNSAYSSSYIYNTTTKEKSDLPEDWKKINIEPLSHIGFKQLQLKQLLDKNIPEIVQESINHFAFGLEHNPKTQEYKKDGKNPLNVLMGVLRKGNGWFESNYKSPQEMAQEQFLEQKKAERERLRKLEQKAYALACDEWLETLSEQQKIEIGGKEPVYDNQRIVMPQDKLAEYFRNCIWPEKKEEYVIAEPN